MVKHRNRKFRYKNPISAVIQSIFGFKTSKMGSFIYFARLLAGERSRLYTSCIGKYFINNTNRYIS